MNNLIKRETNFVSFYKTKKRKRDAYIKMILLLVVLAGIFSIYASFS